MAHSGAVSRCSSSCRSSSPPQTLRLYQVVIFATPVLFGVILVLIFILFYLRRRRIRRVNSRFQAQFFAGTLFSPSAEQGLSKSFRQGLPIIPYDETYVAKTENTQCAVCLGDYQLGEKILEIPVCSHAFHVECIDKWLATNDTCPICRTCLLQDGKLSLVGSSNPPSVGSGDSSRGVESRRWEERVLTELQEGSLRSDGSREDSSNGFASFSESAGRLSIEHAINIERS